MMNAIRSEPSMPVSEVRAAGDAAVGACRRCGTCCRRGGPALHQVDKELIVAGHLSLTDLYTIRAGELVRDDVAGGLLIPADTDIVKIREAPGSRACAFLDPGRNGCTIYRWRPLECRILRCWDTAEIQRRYRLGRLVRADLIGHIDGLWDLVADHDRRCDARRLVSLVRRRRRGGSAAEAELSGMIRYDEALREGLGARGRVPATMLDFLLGRPVRVLLRAMGVLARQVSMDGTLGEPGKGP
ncbi:MAG: YkgJ family cysteine cluster protein [Desulfobacteraceae bacterium]|jgi:Fe-S-cluster containining protein|nr:YkgJ family cysteine cluster protein [Desulfobacteraceae bacterium]